MDKQIRLYLSMKLATETHNLNPDRLDDKQQAQLKHSVDRVYQLQQRIVNSDEAQSVLVSKTDIEQAYQTCISQCDSLQQFQALMSSQGLTEQGLKAALARELMCDKVLDEISDAVPELPREQALAYYQKHKIDFSRGRTWKLSQILITINPDFEENRPDNALKRINMVRKQCEHIDFGQLALEHSECPSALEDGLLGWCEEGKLHPEIVAELAELEQGALSQPIETEVGYHLVICHDAKPPYVAPFEEVLPFLQQRHLSRAKSFIQRQWMAQLTSQ
ncbi:peptidylprolyl isomerase [Vibrio maritimus]|uniref:peptidylprolyl isomerase n=1 Tax=Vibrio maritimus TaxID=990268 RepID=UPI003736B3D5